MHEGSPFRPPDSILGSLPLVTFSGCWWCRYGRRSTPTLYARLLAAALPPHTHLASGGRWRELESGGQSRVGSALNRITEREIPQPALPRVHRNYHGVLLEQNPRAPSQREPLPHRRSLTCCPCSPWPLLWLVSSYSPFLAHLQCPSLGS